MQRDPVVEVDPSEIPEEFAQFGDLFTRRLRRRGSCWLFIMGDRSAPRFKDQAVRRMFVDVPKGWYIKPMCGSHSCIEPEHMMISPNCHFSDTSTPVVFKYPRRKKYRSFIQFKKDFLEV